MFSHPHCCNPRVFNFFYKSNLGGPVGLRCLRLKKLNLGGLVRLPAPAVPGFAAGSHSHMILNKKTTVFKTIRPASGAGRPNPLVLQCKKLNLGGLVWLPAPAGPGDAAGVPFSYVSHCTTIVFIAILWLPVAPSIRWFSNF